MKRVLIFFSAVVLLIFVYLAVIIIGYPVTEINHSSLTASPNKKGYNLCVKEIRHCTRILRMDMKMKNIYSYSEFQYYLKNNGNGEVVIINSVPDNINIISICYFPKRELWVGLSSNERGYDTIIDMEVIIITSQLNVTMKTVKTSNNFNHPINYEYPGDTLFSIDVDKETIKYLSPEEKIEEFKF